MTDNKPDEKNDGKTGDKSGEPDRFPIRDFPDPRCLRCGGRPLPDDEGDFDLPRSSTEEALEYLRNNLYEDPCPGPELREFMDDE